MALFFFGLLLPAVAWGVDATGGTAEIKLPSDRIALPQLDQYSQLAVKWMQDYLRIDTTNPPGNELVAAKFLQKLLQDEGLETRLFEFTPGRANLWARVKGSGERRPLILLNHMDVVTSDPQHWRVPPFSGKIVDGAMYGRGAQDMKNEGLAQLMVMVVLARQKTKLDRDVIFLATSDEEVAGTGTDWMIRNQPDLLENAEYLITEGGENILENERVKYVGVDVAEKATFWLHLVAHGKPGHGSRPMVESAPNRLVRALNRAVRYPTELKLLPVTEQFLHEMAAFEPPARAEEFLEIRKKIKDKGFQSQLEYDESLNYLLRNTISLTMLGGSQQTNVIPNEAWANLDVRLLPGEEPQKFLETIRRVVADPNVTVEPLQAGFRKANASSINTELFRSIRHVTGKYFGVAPVVPMMAGGYTENQRYRELGIVCYGFTPYASTPDEGDTEHGDDERVRVEEVKRGYRVLYDVVVGVAGAN